MGQELEVRLKKAMVLFGRAVEATIARFRRARVHVETRGGIQPLLALESQLPLEKVHELIAAGEDKILHACLPKLSDKRALEIAEGPVRFLSPLIKRGAKLVMGVEIGGGTVGKQGDLSRGFIVRGLPTMLPFSAALFDYVVARLATAFQGELSTTLREMGRVLVAGGQGVLIDYHPFGLYAKSGPERLRPPTSPVRGIEDYYKLARAAGLRVVDLREASVDTDVRSRFAPEILNAYRALKGTPLIVALFLYKPRSERQP